MLNTGELQLLTWQIKHTAAPLGQQRLHQETQAFVFLLPPFSTTSNLSSSCSFLCQVLWDLESTYLGWYCCNRGHQLFSLKRTSDGGWRSKAAAWSCPKPLSQPACQLSSICSNSGFLISMITASKTLISSLFCSLPLPPSYVSFHPFKTKGMWSPCRGPRLKCSRRLSLLLQHGKGSSDKPGCQCQAYAGAAFSAPFASSFCTEISFLETLIL